MLALIRLGAEEPRLFGEMARIMVRNSSHFPEMVQILLAKIGRFPVTRRRRAERHHFFGDNVTGLGCVLVGVYEETRTVVVRAPWWLVLLSTIALLMGVIALAVSTAMWIDKDAEEVASVDLPKVISGSEAEAVADIRLPAGTTLLTAIRQSTGRGLEYRTWLKFRLPREELDRFLSDSRLPAPVPGLRAITDKSSPGSDTWHPDKARDVAGIDDYLESWDSGSVMFDLDHPADITVYLYIVER